jgi:hypothetical protein
MDTTLETVAREYTLRDGIITDPGRYEGEPWYVVVLAEEWEGGADETLYDGETPIDVWFVDSEMRTAFDLDPDTYALALSYSDQGFAYVEHLTEAQYFAGVADLEAQSEDGGDE